jgi:hypothetical protein
LEAFGAAPADINAALAEQPSADFRLWPENEQAIDLFIAMSTQVRTAGLNGRVIGFDYAVLPWVMRRIGIARRDESAVFRQLQIAEDELLK